MLDAVPVIDFAPFLDGAPSTRRRIAREVGKACEDIGFFILIGHGVAPDLVQQTYDTAHAFFDLPHDEKMRIRRPAPEQNRGYNGFGQEALSYSIGQPTPPDLKEFLSIGPVDIPDEPYYQTPPPTRTSRRICGRNDRPRYARPGRPIGAASTACPTGSCSASH